MARGFIGVLFDMDGLLLDSERIYRQVWQLAIRDFDLPWEDEFFHSLIGRNGPDSRALLAARYGARYEPAGFQARLDHHWREVVADAPVPLKEGAAELLDFLDERAIPRAVATSTGHQRARDKLTHSGIYHRFHGLIGGDQVSAGKPHPEPYQKAAALLGLDVTRCLALEDSFNGIRSAHAAGAAAVMVPDLVLPTDEITPFTHRIAPSLLAVRDWLAGQID